MPYDPAKVEEEVITPIRLKVEHNLREYFTGKSVGYDSAADIVEEGLWAAFDRGVEVEVIVIENLSQLQEAIQKTILEAYHATDDDQGQGDFGNGGVQGDQRS